jgi:hypothetical protein
MMLFADDMLVSRRRMVEFSKIMARVNKTFQMKDQAKQILGIEVHKDGIHGKMWLSQ